MTVLFGNILFGGGAGGRDSHNLGYFATPEALRQAHPTAEQGDWAIVGSTDTVWVWDVEGNNWKDTGESVSIDNTTITQNAQNKLQTVAIIDQNSGYKKLWAGTLEAYNAITTKDNNTIYIVDGDLDEDAIQYTIMPVAGVNYENRLVQFVGATSANYIKGQWYLCVNNGGTYSWVQTNVDAIATNLKAGLVKPDGTTIVVDANGVISAVGGGSITDVQVNGTSVVTGTVANIPYNVTMQITYSDGTTGTASLVGIVS